MRLQSAKIMIVMPFLVCVQLLRPFRFSFFSQAREILPWKYYIDFNTKGKRQFKRPSNKTETLCRGSHARSLSHSVRLTQEKAVFEGKFLQMQVKGLSKQQYWTYFVLF